MEASVEDLKARLDRAVKKRNNLAVEVNRIEGRREEAQSRLEGLEKEFKSRGIDPDSAEEVLEGLRTRFEKVVVEIETKVADAEKSLAPFMGQL